MENKYEKHWGYRAVGLAFAVLGGSVAKIGLDSEEILPTVLGTYLLIDGTVDVLTGYHNYCLKKGVDRIKYVGNKLRE